MDAILKPNKIVYSDRKSIALIINSNGDLIVRAPLRCSMTRITKFIQEKRSWIEKKVEQCKANRIEPLKVQDGELIPILDKIYTIKLIDTGRTHIEEDTIFVPRTNAKLRLRNFLIRIAKNYITKRVEYISELTSLKYTSVTITKAKGRWGSCGYKNSLNFTYKLVLCPTRVVDYCLSRTIAHNSEESY